MTQRAGDRKRALWPAALGLAAAVAAAGAGALAVQAQPRTPASGGPACPGGDAGITLPPGFCATVFADNLGNVRHIAVAADGTLYANTWNGSSYFPRSTPAPDGFLIALQDTRHEGKADRITHFGQTPAEGSKGGTGIGLYKGFVYAEMNDKIVRYPLAAGSAVPADKPEVVVSGMPLGGDHPMHPFAINAKGQMFVDMGTATNACQPRNRVAGVPGAQPCDELITRGGTWLYSADKLGQAFSPAERYATGIRNGMGLAFDGAGRLFATQHGRDQLLQNWPKLYPDAKMATELPSEELMMVRQGGDYGWPFCYYDNFQRKLVLAPEYAGDGGKAVGVCASKIPPVAAFPAHWAPNDLQIYGGKAFPAAYQGGAFIAFHGSWNRAPAAQDGFNVVFQPLKDGKASGNYVVFADGFAGPNKASGKAVFRPSGLAVGPDGALYISDDVKGRIWRVTYQGPVSAPATGAPAPTYAQPAAPAAGPGALPVPPGATAEQVAKGMALFQGGSCGACHGKDAAGGSIGPPLTTGSPLWTDGSLAQITDLISKGVPAPKQYRSPMPPMGGAQLSPDDLAAVSAYVWAVGHQPK
ncbi:MAG TPA: c-type cytochrome [Phenylobacterium sp.]|jgi:glucose/arabinose dehydrogenase/mono/diheme cytochrome c family protein|uniref:c-type cytochrome n=1 Tax=Phenylobacterium sp. TaxID=1871053 RepID=UPI002C72AEB0|nr:c-type cytochrome [Phenylobacterium sp.]HXA40053.1 c-type cytochrome [Phenylobacterium sp.]